MLQVPYYNRRPVERKPRQRRAPREMLGESQEERGSPPETTLTSAIAGR